MNKTGDMMRTWLTLFLLSALFTGCNSGIQTNVNEDESSAQTLLSKGTSSMQDENSFTILNSGQYPISTEGEKETTIYHSDSAEDVAAFEEAYMRLTNEVAPSFEGTIIIAKMGQKSTGGYSIEVESVKDSGRFMELTLVSKSPNALATMALTNPFVVVYLPNNHKDVKIIDK